MHPTAERVEGMGEMLDALLDRVIAPTTGTSVARLGLVERFRFQPEHQRLIVLCRHIASNHACSAIFDHLLFEETVKRLRAELESAFPDLNVSFRFAGEASPSGGAVEGKIGVTGTGEKEHHDEAI